MREGASFVGFIPVRDTAVAREFYERVLGLNVLSEDPFAMVVEAGGTVVRLTAAGSTSLSPSQWPGGPLLTSWQPQTPSRRPEWP